MNRAASPQVLIAGGGIGGLAAALASARAGWLVRLYERAPQLTEVGAGIQLGPNVVRELQAWGLMAALEQVAAFPDRLQVRDALSGGELGSLRLGSTAQQRYGAPYATIHRADLHQLLHQSVAGHELVDIHLGQTLTGYAQTSDGVTLQLQHGQPVEGDALVGADGLWSRVRQQMLADGPARVTGHLAYRAMVPQASLPAALRSQQVTVWLGPRLHAVQYPVRRGEWLNLVVIVEGQAVQDLQGWDHQASAAALHASLGPICPALRAWVEAIPEWRLWALCDRAPMAGAHQQAQGRVALLGDAAHPMRPYLAQGAGMAIEDAAELGRVLAQFEVVQDVPLLLRRYALNRWQRNARVQARSIRNGEVFHLAGPLAWARDAAMKLLGESLLDLPWLYQGPSR